MVVRNPKPPADIGDIIREGKTIQAAFEDARRDALLDHKRTGDPIVVWENGLVVWIPAEKIEIPDPPPPRD